jgi:3-hydroxyisobutyrate dehydrogenase-like beta-hydroxyacid dehydrogenase
MEERIGFIGLGMMGKPMAERIIQSGRSLAVYNRTKGKADELVRQGAQWCDSPADVARRCDAVFSMVSTSEVLADIAIGNGELLSNFSRGAVHVDFSTVSPTTTGELAQRYHARGCSFLHAPVLGSIPQATDGTLLLFVGGETEAYQKVRDVLNVLGKRHWTFARVEQASHTKLLCNLFIAGMITTLAQAFVFSEKADVDPKTLLEILSHSAMNAPMYQSKGNSLNDRNFAPRFFLEHMLKDIQLMLSAAESLHVPLPGIESARELFTQANNMGFRKEDYSAVIKVLETMSNVSPGNRLRES